VFLRIVFGRSGLITLVLFQCLLAGSLSNAGQARSDILDDVRGVLTLAPFIERTAPSVVNISVRSRVSGTDNPLYSDPFFRRFFGIPETAPQQRQVMSAGSGVIVNAQKGYVLTNHHVVAKADEITVKLRDGRQYTAKLIGSDEATDIGLLQIDARRLSEIELGDSDALKVGDLVIAIGNPFGLGQTVTSGIVSALGRSGLSREKYENFIQTDASINPGNSGGALINTKGRLIGINTAIIAPGGGNIGIGFAVPVNMARAVMKQLVEFGEIRRGRLGIIIQDLTPEVSEALGLTEVHGAIVREVEPGSAAEAAGIKAGDVVIEFNGRPLRNSSDLRNSVGLVPLGQTLELTIVRDNERQSIRARLGKAEAVTAGDGVSDTRLEGAVFQDAAERAGVLVAKIDNNSPAWRHGLREGDVVIAVNLKKVTTTGQFKAAIEDADSVTALNILRGETELFIVMQ